MGKRIFLHAGAHRTGSSSFQMCLHDNRSVLDRAGYDVAYPGRDGVPGGRLALRLPSPRHEGQRHGKFVGSVRGAVAKFSPDPARALVISEENVPGRMFHFYQGRFFPAAGMRFQCLRDGVGDARLQIVYVLRSYDEIYVSAYRKRAEDNAVADFDALVAKFLGMDRGWPELIAQMQQILRPERLVVVPYDRRGSSAALLTKLLPEVPLTDLEEPEEVLNLSATDAGLMALQTIYRGGGSLARDEWQEVVRSHADDATPRGIAAFGEAERTVLQDRYARDLDRVSAMAGIEMI
ncbi:hypothetical protein LA6_003351 [Marinibacterium anthonyi]|nr:hypothetical protein LA6_003351 [Marinibacterium anthonyi]